jgi:hypothetical protein
VPLKGKVRYRYTKNGVRLAFRGGKVVEAKNTDTGATHTEAEFKADEKRKKKRELPKRGSGLLTPLGQRTLDGFMDKYGDAAGHTKFESAVERGVIDRAKMFKNPGPRHATGKFQSRPG